MIRTPRSISSANVYSVISQPKGDLAMAAAFAGSGDNVSAAIYYQRVYYGFPASAEAGLAATEIDKLETSLDDKYPPALPTAMLGARDQAA